MDPALKHSASIYLAELAWATMSESREEAGEGNGGLYRARKRGIFAEIIVAGDRSNSGRNSLPVYFEPSHEIDSTSNLEKLDPTRILNFEFGDFDLF